MDIYTSLHLSFRSSLFIIEEYKHNGLFESKLAKAQLKISHCRSWSDCIILVHFSTSHCYDDIIHLLSEVRLNIVLKEGQSQRSSIGLISNTAKTCRNWQTQPGKILELNLPIYTPNFSFCFLSPPFILASFHIIIHPFYLYTLFLFMYLPFILTPKLLPSYFPSISPFFILYSFISCCPLSLPFMPL